MGISATPPRCRRVASSVEVAGFAKEGPTEGPRRSMVAGLAKPGPTEARGAPWSLGSPRKARPRPAALHHRPCGTSRARYPIGIPLGFATGKVVDVGQPAAAIIAASSWSGGVAASHPLPAGCRLRHSTPPPRGPPGFSHFLCGVVDLHWSLPWEAGLRPRYESPGPATAETWPSCVDVQRRTSTRDIESVPGKRLTLRVNGLNILGKDSCALLVGVV
jgi:hypothetical protein